MVYTLHYSTPCERGIEGLDREKAWLRLASPRFGMLNFHTRPVPKGVHLGTARGLKVLLGRHHSFSWLPLGKDFLTSPVPKGLNQVTAGG